MFKLRRLCMASRLGRLGSSTGRTPVQELVRLSGIHTRIINSFPPNIKILPLLSEHWLLLEVQLIEIVSAAPLELQKPILKSLFRNWEINHNRSNRLQYPFEVNP